jgi:hypothetical protein
MSRLRPLHDRIVVRRTEEAEQTRGGQRNDTLTSLAGTMRRRGMGPKRSRPHCLSRTINDAIRRSPKMRSERSPQACAGISLRGGGFSMIDYNDPSLR